MRSIDNRFYKTKQWQQCRASFIAERIRINGGVCTMCNEMPGKIVHHRQHLNEQTVNDPELAYGFGNLDYVCHRCHNKIHTADILDTEYLFDAFGNPIPR